MDPVAILTAGRSALEVVAKRTLDLLRSLPDTGVPIPDSRWTVREAAVHLASYGVLHAEMARGVSSPVRSIATAALAKENDERIADIPESDPEKLAELVSEGVGGFLEATAGRSGDQPVVFSQQISLDLAALAGIVLGEQVLHGYDMARAVHRPWPIDPEHARLILYGYECLLPAMVNPERARELTAATVVELTTGDRFTLRFTAGRCTIEPADSGPVDCTISVDPVALLLVGSGRLSQWEAIALGIWRTEGLRPEPFLRFSELFAHP
jgi:uncharacterized protein (TIGR03083 family)